MSMALVFLGDIGKSPPHPSRLRQNLLLRRLRLQRSEIALTSQDLEEIFQYLLEIPRPLSQYPRFENYQFPRFCETADFSSLLNMFLQKKFINNFHALVIWLRMLLNWLLCWINYANPLLLYRTIRDFFYFEC